MDRETIISVIKALSEKTLANGCTEAEANAAILKINELLKTYNLSLDKIFLDQTDCIAELVETNRLRQHPVKYCCNTIAQFCDCRCWVSKKLGKIVYYFFGMPSDTQMAKYLYNIVYFAMEYETNKFMSRQVGGGKTARSSFQLGMSNRINVRLKKIIQNRQVKYVSGSTSLVVLKNQKRDSELEKLNLHLSKTQAYRTEYNHNAFIAGKDAGNRVQLNPSLGERQQNATTYLTHSK